MPAPVSPERLMELAQAWVDAATAAARDYPDHRIPKRMFPEAKAFREALFAQPDAGAMAEAERIAADFEEAGFISPSSFDVIASALAIYGTRREAAGFARGVSEMQKAVEAMVEEQYQRAKAVIDHPNTKDKVQFERGRRHACECLDIASAGRPLLGEGKK